ncbi:hypothetical protein R580_019845 [Salmonella enterica subsp. enterica serovar Tennessee]|nr:hypothetical protein R580_019845 [Salmonella enterica subsp. enterica serovar Tennessee]
MGGVILFINSISYKFALLEAAMSLDKLAESLEESGLWRRASRRWLEVFDMCMDEDKRKKIIERREFCSSMMEPCSEDKRRETKKHYMKRRRQSDGY